MRKENPTPKFPELEREILAFWEKEKCFEKLVEKNKDGDRFRFLDGPITANNPMGIHHAWGRAMKDMYIRYNAMHGKSCQYQNGFDAQGLWVEVETEKDLGIREKKDIENYGIDKFTEKCMERVSKFANVITEQSKRLGQWMDWDNSYFTNSDLNITSIWYFLKKCNENGWLKKTYRPMPWCPRCGTSLSEHEMSGSYRDVEHLSIFAKLPILGMDAKIVLWTTTPWTLTSNAALAVNPDIDYVKVKVKSDALPLIVGAGAIGRLKGDIIEVSEPFKGKELVGREYETCFSDLEVQKFPHKIYPWEDVDATEGTGVVHIAPGCGKEDYDLGLIHGIPAICPINDEGIIIEGFGEFSGLRTDELVSLAVEMLEKSEKLYKTEEYSHSYPHCWRCKTPVVFKLVDEWNILTDEVRVPMIEAAKTVSWEPDYSEKRMIDWLNNMGDWNISRKRFYGLPLPFYPCKKCGHLTVIGSKEELITRSENGNIDGVPHLHRPYIDTIKIHCEKCGELVERVPEVGDCWLDAGITPFSTKGYFTDKEYFSNNFPSDMVLEMKEQIRLWFYSMLFMSVTLTGKAPYKQVIAHSSVVQESGEKFSKTGHMIRFDDAAERMGADAVRYLYASAPVVSDVRFGYGIADEARRKIISFWNVYIFFNLYAEIDNPNIENHKLVWEELNHTDKWLLTRTNMFIEQASTCMDTFKHSGVIKEFESFVDEVSNWYIRINRKRFWKTLDKQDQMNAYTCLYNAIKAVLGVMAPITPFLSDYIYQNTVRVFEKNAPISIHLTDYPKARSFERREELIRETSVARGIITTVQRMRNEAQIKIKQPLQELYILPSANYNNLEEDIESLKQVVLDELNVKELVFTNETSEFYDPYFIVNFKVAGRTLKSEAQALKGIIDAMSREEFIELDKEYVKGKISVGKFVDLDSEVLEKHFRPKHNFIVVTEKDYTLALNTSIDLKLMAEGLIRELIRLIQVMRKETGYTVEQRVIVDITAKDSFATTAINENLNKICADILAISAEHINTPDSIRSFSIQDSEIEVKLKKA